MPETIPGGAYLAADGETWLNAKGERLTRQQIAEAEKLNAERADLREAEEEARVALQVKNDPLAQTLARALMPQPVVASSTLPKAPSDTPPTPKATKG